MSFNKWKSTNCCIFNSMSCLIYHCKKHFLILALSFFSMCMTNLFNILFINIANFIARGFAVLDFLSPRQCYRRSLNFIAKCTSLVDKKGRSCYVFEQTENKHKTSYKSRFLRWELLWFNFMKVCHLLNERKS